jgi:hypothetical protein
MTISKSHSRKTTGAEASQAARRKPLAHTKHPTKGLKPALWRRTPSLTWRPAKAPTSDLLRLRRLHAGSSFEKSANQSGTDLSAAR